MDLSSTVLEDILSTNLLRLPTASPDASHLSFNLEPELLNTLQPPRRRINKYLAYPFKNSNSTSLPTKPVDTISEAVVLSYDSLDIKYSKDNAIDIKLSLSDFNDDECSSDKKKTKQIILKAAQPQCKLSITGFNLQDYFESYTVAYNSPERAAQMTDRFAKIGLPLNVHTGVQMDDPRLEFAGEDMSAKRLASVFYGHLDNIADFYESGKPYGLFCEDDVHLHKDLGKELPIIIGEFNAMQLDILLLGYMTTKTIEWWQQGYPLMYDGGVAPYRYHRYPKEQWGIHLFMISKSYAKTLLEVYGPDYAAKAHKDTSMTCCNPDWTLSKYSQNRALRYPMLAVEDGKGNYDHHGQGEYHRESHRKNYREGEFW